MAHKSQIQGLSGALFNWVEKKIKKPRSEKICYIFSKKNVFLVFREIDLSS